jgi:hypothetical protein
MMSKSEPSLSRKVPAADEVQFPVVPGKEIATSLGFPGEVSEPDDAAVEFLANLLPMMETTLTESVSRKSAAFGNRA